MSRRRRSSAADDLLHIASKLPWWVGVALAFAVYFELHKLAGQPVATATQPGQAGFLAVKVMIATGASFLQYIVPIILLAGAGVSAWRQRERKTLAANVAASPAADVLDGMTWRQFERLVGEAFRMKGYTVTETGGGGADGGVDLILTKAGEKFIVQCKQWRAFKVGVDVVRELYGVMAAKGATGGFVVTSGRYTDEATKFAAGRNVTLIDGPQLHTMIQQAMTADRNIGTPAPARTPGSNAPLAQTTSPACPLCSKPMVKRQARRGANAGSEFWAALATQGARAR